MVRTLRVLSLMLAVTVTSALAAWACGSKTNVTGVNSGCGSEKAASIESTDSTMAKGGADQSDGMELKSASYEATEPKASGCPAKGQWASTASAEDCPPSKDCPATGAACAEFKSTNAEKVAKSGCSGHKASSTSLVSTTEQPMSVPGGGDEAGKTKDGEKMSGDACCPAHKAKSTSIVSTEQEPATAPGGATETNKAKDSEKAAKAANPAYKLGSAIPDLKLKEAVSGEEKALSSLAGDKATVLIFWNQECPYVVEAQDRIAEFHNANKDKGVKVVALDGGYNNSLENIKQHASTKPFPILVSPDTKVAAQFAATRTPEVFLLDKDMKVVYHGAFDSGKVKAEDAGRKTYVADAVKALLAGEKIQVAETRAFGCNLKYAEGVKPLE